MISNNKLNILIFFVVCEHVVSYHMYICMLIAILTINDTDQTIPESTTVNFFKLVTMKTLAPLLHDHVHTTAAGIILLDSAQ